jgi:hypothetical protein
VVVVVLEVADLLVALGSDIVEHRQRGQGLGDPFVLRHPANQGTGRTVAAVAIIIVVFAAVIRIALGIRQVVGQDVAAPGQHLGIDVRIVEAHELGIGDVIVREGLVQERHRVDQVRHPVISVHVAIAGREGDLRAVGTDRRVRDLPVQACPRDLVDHRV